MISEQTAPLDKLPVVLKAGTEQLGSTGKTLSDFWRQQQLSRIIFSIRPTRSWNGETGGMNETPGRSADAYVFCLLNHQDKETLNPLDLKQWEFYVLSTTELNTYARNGTSITLASVQKLTDEIPFEKLRNAVWEKGKP